MWQIRCCLHYDVILAMKFYLVRIYLAAGCNHGSEGNNIRHHGGRKKKKVTSVSLWLSPLWSKHCFKKKKINLSIASKKNRQWHLNSVIYFFWRTFGETVVSLFLLSLSVTSWWHQVLETSDHSTTILLCCIVHNCAWTVLHTVWNQHTKKAEHEGLMLTRRV